MSVATVTAPPLARPIALAGPTLGSFHLGRDSGIDQPVLPAPSRAWWMPHPRVRTALSLAVFGVVCYLVAPEIARSLPALGSMRLARSPWLAVTVAVGGGNYLFSAIGLRSACGLRYSLRRAVAGQIAAAFGNRVLPIGLGAVGVNLRFLERAGMPRTAAVTSLAITKVLGIVVHVALLLTVLTVGATGGFASPVPTPDLTIAAWVVGAVAAGSLLAVLFRTRLGWIGPHARLAAGQVAVLWRCPRTAWTLITTTVLGKLSQMAALAASLLAFGVHVSFVTVAIVFLAGSTVASAIPTPGGVGAVEAALFGGLLAAGVTAGPAMAAVLTFRLLTHWAPVLPGAALFFGLRRRGAL